MKLTDDPSRSTATSNAHDARITDCVTTRTGKAKQMFSSSRKNRRGAAVVEFAMVVPVFVLLVFGMIEFGRAVMV